jgi:hypothetical protein
MRWPENLEVVDDEMAEIFRRKTGAERLQIAFGLFTSARRMLISHLTSEHPDWDEKKIRCEAARRISRGAVQGTECDGTAGDGVE